MSAPANSQAGIGVPEAISPTSLLGNVVGQWSFLPINGAAFVMQVMHPVIGDIVGRYSVYDTDPYGRAIRSFDAVLQWTYGGIAAIEMGYHLRKMHQPLQMRDASGKHISALNPEAYGWVLATGALTAFLTGPLTIGREFTVAEQEAMYADILVIRRILQIPDGVLPECLTDFWAYTDSIIERRLTVHPVAQKLVEQVRQPVLPPALPQALAPAWRLPSAVVGKALSAVTISGMPPRIREILGVHLSKSDLVLLSALRQTVPRVNRTLPERLTYAPVAFHARQLHRAIGGMRARQLSTFTGHERLV